MDTIAEEENKVVLLPNWAPVDDLKLHEVLHSHNILPELNTTESTVPLDHARDEKVNETTRLKICRLIPRMYLEGKAADDFETGTREVAHKILSRKSIFQCERRVTC